MFTNETDTLKLMLHFCSVENKKEEKGGGDTQSFWRNEWGTY